MSATPAPKNPTTAKPTPAPAPDTDAELAAAAAEDAEAGDEGDDTVLGQAVFSITDSVITQKQHQVKIDGLSDVFAAQNIDQATMIGAKKGNFVELRFLLKDNTTPTLRMGDTHAIWEQHQKTADQKALFARIYEACLKGQTPELDVVGAKYQGKGGGAKPGGSTTVVKF